MKDNEKTECALLCEAPGELTSKYPFFTKSTLGRSLGGREIALVSAGAAEAKKSVVYVGAHNGTEYISSAVLTRFLFELGEAARRGGSVCGVNVAAMLERRRVCVVPMLDPDGIELDPPEMRDVSTPKEQSEELSAVSPESEPESAAIRALLRYDPSIRALLSLHARGEAIYCGGGGEAPFGARSIGRTLSRMIGIALADSDNTTSHCDLADRFALEFDRPAFTIECGKGESPLRTEDSFLIYARLRKALFCAPYLV